MLCVCGVCVWGAVSKRVKVKVEGSSKVGEQDVLDVCVRGGQAVIGVAWCGVVCQCVA